jgi:2-hydroxychromene-2-carboxylate isomerase
MRQANWYFDFISPYAYFGLQELPQLAQDVQIVYRPILFVGLLRHWGQRGPAEIPGKRTWTYRSCTWYAAQRGIAFRLPRSHPFNPLGYLRLAIAAGCEPAAIHTIFKRLWTTGDDATDPRVLEELASALGIDHARLSDAAVKEALRAHTQEAIAQQIFGVPTLVIDGELFWGADSMDFVRAYLADPGILRSAEMQRVSDLPVGASRF